MDISLTKLPWWGQIGAFVLVCAGAVFGFWNFYVDEVQKDISLRQTHLNALKLDINKGVATARRLPEFEAQVTDLERRLESLRNVLPEQKDVADLLRRIQTMASQSNLTIRTFRPQAMAQKELHAEWPIGLELEGTYHNVGMFLDKVSKFPRIINVNDIAIRAKGNPEPNSTVTAECTATTFVLMEAKGGRGAGPAVPR